MLEREKFPGLSERNPTRGATNKNLDRRKQTTKNHTQYNGLNQSHEYNYTKNKGNLYTLLYSTPSLTQYNNNNTTTLYSFLVCLILIPRVCSPSSHSNNGPIEKKIPHCAVHHSKTPLMSADVCGTIYAVSR